MEDAEELRGRVAKAIELCSLEVCKFGSLGDAKRSYGLSDVVAGFGVDGFPSLWCESACVEAQKQTFLQHTAQRAVV